MTHLLIDLYMSDYHKLIMCMTQTGPYGPPCVILQAHQQKNAQNPFKTIKLNHFDQLGGQPRTANHLRQVYTVFCCFFPQQGCQKHSRMVVVRAFIQGVFYADRLLNAMNCVLCGCITCACASIRAYCTSIGSPCFCRKSL